MSPLVLVPLAVLSLGAASTAVLVRRLVSTLRSLDETLLAVGHLEASRAGLDGETATARAALDRLASS